MRIFLDTNVLASAFATRGICEDVLREVINFHQLVSSRTVVSELERVLRDKLGVPRQVCADILDFLVSNAEVTGDPELLKLSLRDEADVIIVSAAVHAHADIFVTGDKEITALRQVHGMRLVSPREFWELLQKGTGGTS
jgi:putative PIN family toxin of toxin-antitoxin system